MPNNDKQQAKITALEGRLLENVRDLYATISAYDTIDPTRAASLFKELQTSMANRSKLLSANQSNAYGQ